MFVNFVCTLSLKKNMQVILNKSGDYNYQKTVN